MHATLGSASYDFHSLDVCTVCVPSKFCLHVSVANCKLLVSVVVVRGEGTRLHQLQQALAVGLHPGRHFHACSNHS